MRNSVFFFIPINVILVMAKDTRRKVECCAAAETQ